jgi:hypothetical protein
MKLAYSTDEYTPQLRKSAARNYFTYKYIANHIVGYVEYKVANMLIINSNTRFSLYFTRVY